MPSDHDVIIVGFPHPTIPPILGVPTYATIADTHLKLNANAASVFSSLGDGAHGLLALTVSVAVYNTQSAIAFVAPTNPGPQPNIPNGLTGNQIAAATRTHTENHRLWKEYLATDKALKQQLLATVHETYYRTLRNRITGFANTTTRQLLEHLYRTYGNITPADLIENDTRMKTSYDPSQPIEVLYDQIEDAVELADAANAGYTTAQIIAIAYNCLFQTGLYAEACRDWRRRADADKTWPQLKTDFALAHQELRESQVTSQGAGYHGANLAYEMQQETNEALANLATATASDRSAVSQLSSTNSQLSTQLAAMTEKLNTALAEIALLKIALHTRSTNGATNGAPPTQRPATRRPPTIRKWFNTNYCWTHGYHVADEHTSTSCQFPKPGHQLDATRADTKNGKPWNKTLVQA
jgi:hypothetical protein